MIVSELIRLLQMKPQDVRVKMVTSSVCYDEVDVLDAISMEDDEGIYILLDDLQR